MVWREVRFLLWLLPFLAHPGIDRDGDQSVSAGLERRPGGRLLGLPYAVIITRDYDWDWAVLGKQAFGSIYPTRRLERAIGRWVLRHANLVLADREYYRQFAIRNGTPASRAVATRILADGAYAAAAAGSAAADSAAASVKRAHAGAAGRSSRHAGGFRGRVRRGVGSGVCQRSDSVAASAAGG